MEHSRGASIIAIATYLCMCVRLVVYTLAQVTIHFLFSPNRTSFIQSLCPCKSSTTSVSTDIKLIIKKSPVPCTYSSICGHYCTTRSHSCHIQQKQKQNLFKNIIADYSGLRGLKHLSYHPLKSHSYWYSHCVGSVSLVLQIWKRERTQQIILHISDYTDIHAQSPTSAMSVHSLKV